MRRKFLVFDEDTQEYILYMCVFYSIYVCVCVSLLNLIWTKIEEYKHLIVCWSNYYLSSGKVIFAHQVDR